MHICIFIYTCICIYVHIHLNTGPSWTVGDMRRSEQAAVYLSAALIHYKCIYSYKHIYIYIYLHPHIHKCICINRGPSWIDRGLGGSEQAAVYLSVALIHSKYIYLYKHIYIYIHTHIYVYV